MCQTWAANGHVELGDLDYPLAMCRERGAAASDGFELPLPFALMWRKDNASPLLEKFVAGVRLLPEVDAYSKH